MNDLLKQLEHSSLVPDYRKSDIVDSIVKSTALTEAEKYKIDKMIENGLIKEQSQETISRNKMLDYGFELAKNGKLALLIVATFAFITTIYNSGHYWKYHTTKLEMRKK